MSLKLCFMVCLISLRLIWTLQWLLLNVRIWTFNWVWHEHCNGLFNIRNLVSSLILIFPKIYLCDTIVTFMWYLCDTWFGKKWKRFKKFWRWEICLVYAYFFKHLSLSMLISFMLTKKWVCLNKPVPSSSRSFKYVWTRC